MPKYGALILVYCILSTADKDGNMIVYPKSNFMGFGWISSIGRDSTSQ